MDTIYSQSFYEQRHQKTVHSAETVLSIVLEALPAVNSAIDFGCGVGTWLSVLREKGVEEIRGLDGPWVDRGLLEIPPQDFQQVDFEQPIALQQKYDLAMTLEVAEHISRNHAASFVDSLVSASDFVLFSAAIPFQGGSGHVNEQWPDYWAGMFSDRGYVALDFVRARIWNDPQIPTWYRQNILLFVAQTQLPRLEVAESHRVPLSLVHPDSYLKEIEKMQSVKGSWKLFRRALKNHFRRKEE